MSAVRQIRSVTAMNLLSVPERLGSSMVIVVGIAGVVAVLVSVLAMGVGIIRTMQNAGRADRAIVLRNGSASETGGQIPRDAVRTIMTAPGIRRGSQLAPLLTPEAIVQTTLYKRTDGSAVNAAVRGVGARAFDVRPEMTIVEGRLFRPALYELVVGKAARVQFKDLEIGSHVATRGATWTVVGTFESGGDAHESELVADVDTLMASERRDAYQSVSVLLESAESFGEFKDALTSNPSLAVDVVRERDYFSQQSASVSQFLFIIGYLVGGIMAIGAMFAALNTMYSAVSTRTREIATLRAIGFGAAAVVVSVLAEAVLLAVAGGAGGGLLAWVLLNGHSVSTAAGRLGRGQLVFEITVTRRLLALGIAWAGGIGIVGGLFPAIRAARLPIVDGLRAI